MDKQCLRIIANPYLLKKEKYDPEKVNERNKNKTEKILSLYLENKYDNVFIHPQLHDEISSQIDSVVVNYVIQTVVNEIVDVVANKFDN